MNKFSTPSRSATPVNVAKTQRPASALQVTPRQFVRVLQSGHAPAQLPLFLRPAASR
jgi:hypothetical protein